jgi:indole-3-glycerol phosphate synthase
VIREDLSPGDVARRYEAAGAAALSVLTEETFFGGRLSHLAEARANVALPVLRKDFVVDPWQVWEARAAGADAVLLIVAALDQAQLRELLALVRESGMDALVETHDGDELARALDAGADLVGVNSRDLRTLAVSLETALGLGPRIPDDVVAVAESGIRSGQDVRALRAAGFDAFLVGEQLMSADEPGAALRRLLDDAGQAR